MAYNSADIAVGLAASASSAIDTELGSFSIGIFDDAASAIFEYTPSEDRNPYIVLTATRTAAAANTLNFY